MADKRALTRRGFLKSILTWLGVGFASSLGGQQLSGCSGGAAPSTASTALARIPSPTARPLYGMRFFRQLAENVSQCKVCFKNCVIRESKLGFCKNVKNVGGKCYSLVYGLPCALQVDPIEKEPAFHMLPSSKVFCTGTAMCNYRCKFCHNWEFAQRTLWEVHNIPASPAEVVNMALQEDCGAMSFTYNDPIAFYDYMFDIATLAREKGLKVLCHTNGSLNPEPLFDLLEVLDAIVIDLKAFTSHFYERICSAELPPVLDALRNIHQTETHLEIVNLVIPTLNDDLEDIRRMCAWIRKNLGSEVPIHFIRFSPAYKLQRLPPTPIETMEHAATIADEEGLQYVYIGNAPGHERNSTFCPNCRERIIHRVHFVVLGVDIEAGRCRFCGEDIPGIWWNGPWPGSS